MHFTIRAMRGLYALEKDLRAAPPVVELLAPRRQRGDVGGTEALLDEPVRGVRGEREELAQLERLGTLLAGEQQPLAIAGVAIFGCHRETGELRALVVRERIQRRAAADHAVVLDDEEVADFGFEQFAAPLHQRAIGFQRLR